MKYSNKSVFHLRPVSECTLLDPRPESLGGEQRKATGAFNWVELFAACCQLKCLLDATLIQHHNLWSLVFYPAHL